MGWPVLSRIGAVRFTVLPVLYFYTSAGSAVIWLIDAGPAVMVMLSVPGSA